MTMQIIEANVSHLPGILKVWTELIDLHQKLHYVYGRKDGATHVFSDHLRQSLLAPDSKVFVAIEGDEVLAYTHIQVLKYPPIFKKERFGYITDMCVKEGHRRKAIGDKLLEKAFEWFRSKGVDRVELRVASNNTIGYPFWKKKGFSDYVHVLYKDI
jgi:ribosomal protein S18 acetylase RimI-like enzyme